MKWGKFTSCPRVFAIYLWVKSAVLSTRVLAVPPRWCFTPGFVLWFSGNGIDHCVNEMEDQHLTRQCGLGVFLVLFGLFL